MKWVAAFEKPLLYLNEMVAGKIGEIISKKDPNNTMRRKKLSGMLFVFPRKIILKLILQMPA